MRHPNRNGRQRARQAAARERQEAYDKLTLTQRISRAYKRGGGASRDFDRNPTREFVRLVAQQ